MDVGHKIVIVSRLSPNPLGSPSPPGFDGGERGGGDEGADRA